MFKKDYKTYPNIKGTNKTELGTIKQLNHHRYKISEKDIPVETYPHNHVTIEKLDGKTLLPVYEYLNYKLEKLKNLNIDLEKSEEIKYFTKNIRLLESYLNNSQNNNIFASSKTLFKIVDYKPISYDKGDIQKYGETIGRFYNSLSIQYLPRELRYYLFNKKYRDFDIVNSHPSILLDYALQNDMLSKTPILLNYVKHREEVILKIKKELINSGRSDINNDELKKTIFIEVINNKFKVQQKGSETLFKFALEGQLIRKTLWNSFEKGELPQYKAYIENSELPNDPEEAKLAKQVKLISLYSQTQENFHLTKIFSYLKKKYSEKVQGKFEEYYPDTNKKIDLNPIHTLSLIPFFDGFYISSPHAQFNSSVEKLIKEFNYINTISSNVYFSGKKIKQKKDKIIPEELEIFTLIHEWLQENSGSKKLNKFLNTLCLNSKLSEAVNKFGKFKIYGNTLQASNKV